jgi:hypothetical protein
MNIVVDSVKRLLEQYTIESSAVVGDHVKAAAGGGSAGASGRVSGSSNGGSSKPPGVMNKKRGASLNQMGGTAGVLGGVGVVGLGGYHAVKGIGKVADNAKAGLHNWSKPTPAVAPKPAAVADKVQSASNATGGNTVSGNTAHAIQGLGKAGGEMGSSIKRATGGVMKAIGDNPKVAMVGAGLAGAAALARRRALKRG